MPQEPDWNWKAVIAGVLSNPGVVLAIGVSVVLKLVLTFKGQVPAHEIGLSDAEREQQRAEIQQLVDEMHAANKTDLKIERLAPYIIIGSSIVGCACAVLQGYGAGRVAKKHPLAHAAASYVVTFASGTVVGIAMRKAEKRNNLRPNSSRLNKKRPLKDRLLYGALEAGCVLLGGYLSRRK